MNRRGVNVKEAAELWVSQFSKFPQDMILKLMEIDIDSWNEVTKPSCGRRVYVHNLPEGCEDYDGLGEVENYLEESDMYCIHLDDGNTVEVGEDDFDFEECCPLPMWGWMWQFGDSADDYWLEEMDGIRIMSDCGFRIYQHYEWGYFFGIDGAGYDFYEAHWIPLYRARGLQWHDSDTEKNMDK